MFMEEEPGTEHINATRLDEAKATRAAMLAVGCPFRLKKLNDAAKLDG